MASSDEFERYKLKEIKVTNSNLGQGAFTRVMQLDYMGLECIGKKIHESFCKHENIGGIRTRFQEECSHLSKLRHPNIAQFLGVFFQEEEDIPIMVMEFITMNLTTFIDKHCVFPKEISLSILHDIAIGLLYLHSQAPPILHQDLSSNNVLLTPDMKAKISDLGMARILNISPPQVSCMTQTPSTTAFMPPEVRKANPKHDTSVDIFSYGIIMIHLFSGKYPQSEKQAELRDHYVNLPDDSKKGSQDNTPVNLPDDSEKGSQDNAPVNLTDDSKKGSQDNVCTTLLKLLQSCIEDDPTKRPSAAKILQITSKVVTEFPSFATNTTTIVKNFQSKSEDDEVKGLQEVIREQDKLLEKRAIEYPHEIEQLNQQLRQLKTPLKKQPLQATITWKQCSPPPSDISSMQSTVINGMVYLGGEGGGVVYCYDPSEDNWNALPQLPVKDFGLGQFESKVVAIGGVNIKDNKRSNRLYTLTPHWRSHRWDEKRVPPMPTARSLVTVASLESGIFVAGGQMDTNKPTDVVELFKRDRSHWYKVDVLKLPTPCYNMSVAISGNSLYLLGGYDDKESKQNQTLCTSVDHLLSIAEWDIIYQGITVDWKILQSTPAHHPMVAMLNNNPLAIGGWEVKTNRAQAHVHIFCPSINTWVYVDDLPQCLSWTVSATLSSTNILVIGRNYEKNQEIMYKGLLTAKLCT